MRSSLSQRLSPVRDAHWDRLSLEASLFNAFNQEDNVEEETTAIDDSESSVDEDDVQGTIQKAIRDRFGAKDNEGKKAKSANAIQEDVASAIGRLLNKCMNGKELLQLAANVTAPSFARPLPTKDKKVRFSSLSLSEVGSRPHAITTLDECLVEALDRMMKENARLKEENEELQDVIDRIGSWSDSSDKKQLQEEKKQPSLIQRLLHDEENDPSASFGSRFYAPEEDEAAEVEEEQEVAKAETKPPSFDTFLHSAIDKQVSEALFS